MWQQVPAALTANPPDESGPWQQPADAGESPGGTGPRWQKHSPADAFSNAAASIATPRIRTPCFIR